MNQSQTCSPDIKIIQVSPMKKGKGGKPKAKVSFMKVNKSGITKSKLSNQTSAAVVGNTQNMINFISINSSGYASKTVEEPASPVVIERKRTAKKLNKETIGEGLVNIPLQAVKAAEVQFKKPSKSSKSKDSQKTM